MMTVEQIVNVQKSNVETLFGLTGTAFEGIEKLVELNLQVAKSAMADAAANAKAVLSVKDAQELLALPPRRPPRTAAMSTKSPPRPAPK